MLKREYLHINFNQDPKVIRPHIPQISEITGGFSHQIYYLLSAIDEQAGIPLIIKENEVSNGINVRVRSNASDYYIDGIKVRPAPDVKENNDIQFQKIKIKTNIYVKFSIK